LRTLAITALVLGLLGATTAAFAVTEALKLERSPITAPRFDKRFSPTCECETRSAHMALRFRKSDSIDAYVVDSAGDRVRALTTDERVQRGNFSFLWDGRTDGGAVATDGRYRLWVHLDEQRRTILLPNTVEIDTAAPRLKVLEQPRRVFSPDGNGRGDKLEIRYRANEKASVDVLVGGDVVVRGKARPQGEGKVSWQGELDGEPAEPGVYEVAIQARDPAGNIAAAVPIGDVRVQYVSLARNVLRVRRGGVLRFRVVGDALPFRWRLTRQTGARASIGARSRTNAVAVRLPRSLKSGRYTLEVESSGRRDAALVYVTRAAP
jgi:flagellar hook assembly protein FlgD